MKTLFEFLNDKESEDLYEPIYSILSELSLKEESFDLFIQNDCTKLILDQLKEKLDNGVIDDDTTILNSSIKILWGLSVRGIIYI